MANILYLNQYFITTLNVGGGIDDSQTTGVYIADDSGIDTTKPGIALINYADPLNTSIAEWVEYSSLSSKEFQGLVRGQEGFSAKAHDNGVQVAFPLSESHINRLADALSIGGTATNGVTTTLDEDTMVSNSATALATQQSIKSYVDDSTVTTLYRNAIINGNMDIWQRGSSFVAGANNDDVYTADRWNLISDGNDAVDVSREATEKPDGSMYSMKFDTETAKRYGVVQIIENIDTKKLDNKTVSLSFMAKTTSSQVGALRAAVLTWGSTADAVTSDVVGTWDATPTWATNWTQENTPSDISITDSWATYKIEGISIDSDTVNNIAVVIWTPNEETIGDVWYLSQVQLNEGSMALQYQPKTHSQELIDCQRYCIAYTSSNVSFTLASGYNYNTSLAICAIQFPTQMRSIPTLVATAADWQINYLATSSAATGIAIDGNTASPYGSGLAVTVTGTPLTAGQGCVLAADGNANRLMYFQAEL